MKKILFLLLVTIAGYGQTLQNPTFGTVTTKTNIETATANKISVQETDGKINWLQPVNIPIPIVPTNYMPTATTLGGHLTGIDNKLGTIVATTAGVTTRVWFTADVTVVSATNYYTSNATSKGTLASAIQSVVNDDNQKKYFTQDIIGTAFAANTLFPAGIYAGNLSASTTPNSAQQRWTVELYKCNNAGTPIASGITGAPVGSLGVTVVTILDSGLLTLADGSVTNVQVSGNLASPLSMAVGERIRYHVSAEKVGTAASNITQSVYYGTSYNSYLDVPVPLNTTAVQNLSVVVGGNTTEALNTLYNSTSSTTTVYVQSTGNNTSAQVGNINRPFLTIDAALDALPASGGVVKIGVGTFFSPTKAKIKEYTVFQGSGKPVTNSTITYTVHGVQPTISSPTKLVGGTILLGIFDGSLKNGIEVRDLGIDAGLDYCNTYNGGVQSDALFFGQFYDMAGGLPSQDGIHQLQTNSPPKTGIVVENVSALCKSAAALCHAMLIENTLNAKVTNVSTYYGVHGLVIKSMGCKLDGLDAHGHGENGLIFKSEDYAYGIGNSATNVYVTSIIGDDGGGIRFMSVAPGFGLLNNNLSNFTIEYTSYGIDNVYAVDGSNISNGSIFKTTGIGIDVDSNFINSTFSNIDQRSGTTGFLVGQSLAPFHGILITNCFVAANSVKGYNLTATSGGRISINNSYADNAGVGSVISGNVYGEFKDTGGGVTGAFLYDNSSATDFLMSLDSNNIPRKSHVKINSTGKIETPEDIVVTGTYKGLVFDHASTSQIGGFIQKINGVDHWVIAEGAGNGSSDYNIYNYGGGGALGTAGIAFSLNKLTNVPSFLALAGSGTRQVVANASGEISATDIAPTSGTYTPTLTNVTNVSSVVIQGVPTYSRVGNIVTVSIGVNVSPTLGASTLTSFTATLPVTRGVATPYNVGSASLYNGSTAIVPGYVQATSATVVTCIFFPLSVTAVSGTLTFQYQI